jgi:hypothetical protein
MTSVAAPRPDARRIKDDAPARWRARIPDRLLPPSD